MTIPITTFREKAADVAKINDQLLSFFVKDCNKAYTLAEIKKIAHIPESNLYYGLRRLVTTKIVTKRIFEKKIYYALTEEAMKQMNLEEYSK